MNEMIFETETQTMSPLNIKEAAYILSLIPYDHYSVTWIRRLIAVEHNPPIEEIIKSSVGDFLLLPHLISLVNPAIPNKDLVFEAAWALTNIVSGTSEQTMKAVEFGAIKSLSSIIFSVASTISNGLIPASVPCSKTSGIPVYLAEQAIWGIGNIAGDSFKMRDLVFDSNVLNPITQIIDYCLSHQSKDNLPLFRNSCWTLSNFNRGKPTPQIERIRQTIPTLCKVIQSNFDNRIESKSDSIWGLCFISDTNSLNENDIKNILSVVIPCLSIDNINILVPSLRCIGNIVTSNDPQNTKLVLETDVLPSLEFLLDHRKNFVKKETCWVISNITAGTLEQAKAVVEQSNIMRKLIVLANDCTDFDIRKEVIWAISNACATADSELSKDLFDLNCLQPLFNVLQTSNNEIVKISMESIQILLHNFKKSSDQFHKVVIDKITEIGGLEKLEKLLYHQNEQILSLTDQILDEHFPNSHLIVQEAEPASQREEKFEIPSKIQKQ